MTPPAFINHGGVEGHATTTEQQYCSTKGQKFTPRKEVKENYKKITPEKKTT